MRGASPANLVATLVLLFGLVLALLFPALGASHGRVQVATPAAESAQAGWTNFKGDAGRRGVADAGPTGQPVRLWRVQADGPCNAPPAVVAGVVYAPCGDGVLYVLDAATGAERWRFTGAGPLGDVTVVGGLVYVNDTDVLRALDAPTGQERWHAAVPGGTGAVVDGGLLVLGTGDGFLLGLDAATGTERWRFPVTTQGGAHNAALGGGVAYVGGDGVGLVAVDAATGALLWRGDTGTDQTGTAVVADGIAYIGGNPDAGGGHLYAFDATSGALLWRRDEPLFTPAVLDGVGYSGSVAGIVSAFDTATGTERWRVQLGGIARPLAVAPGVVYAPSDGDHAVYALDAATGKQLWSFAVDGGIDGSLAVDGGAAYVTTVFGGIYAVGGTDQGAIASPVATSPTVAPTPVPTMSATEAASPVVVTGPAVEPVWQTTGGATPLRLPNAMAFDPDGNLWVADAHSQFHIFDPDGTFLESWGIPGAAEGQFDFLVGNGDNYGGVAFGADGAIYVVDPGNARVQKFDKTRAFVTSWGGSGTGDGQFLVPISIAVDADGLLYVLDNRRDEIQVFDEDGTFVRAFRVHAAFGVSVDRAANSTNQVAVDAGNVYVTSALRGSVLVFGADGHLLTEMGSPGSGDGQFGQPVGIAIGVAGMRFVTDFASSRVLVFAPDGSFRAAWGEFGTGPGQFTAPAGIAIRGQDLYVADYDSGRVQKFRLLPPLASA